MLAELTVFVVFGIVIGAVGRLMVVGGPTDGTGPWIGRGVLGALFGGLLGQAAGGFAPGATPAVLASFVGAIVFVALHFAKSWWASPQSGRFDA
jgi:uncharacterized membrane protein YeaQ/YmgE (transglycosylase-associated protein family)